MGHTLQSMRVISTGISGTQRLELLREVVALAARRGLDVALYDVRETMFEVAQQVGEPVDEETILDNFPRALVLLRAAALEKILSQIEARASEHWILNTHAVFRWKNSLISGFDPHYLARLDPHLFLTVTTGIKTTLARLGGQPRWAAMTEEDVLVWREEEQFFAEEMARIHRKQQVLLPRSTSVESLYRLLFEPGWTRAYLSYPMQHVTHNAERGLAAFKAQLEQRLVVFDPAAVNDFAVEDAAEPSTNDGSVQLGPPVEGGASVQRSRLQQHIADQIVVRDYKLIQQSGLVVVYYDVPVASPGVISEMKFALESGKQVLGVWLPQAEPSVFFTRYCTTWFRSVDDLFAYLRQHRLVRGGGSRHGRTRAEREAERVAREAMPQDD